jgi:localization factor PodJL
LAKAETAPVALVPAVKPVAGKTAAGITIDRDAALPAKLADLEKRAFEGVPEAQHDLATLYASGKIVAQNYKRAAYWFSKAADGGVANAHYNLGVMFQQGLGVHKDLTKALAWYQRAAQLGHPEAMYNLGIAYIEGIGVDRNSAKGVAYFKNAANAGVAQAAYNLGVLYESNFVGPIDIAKALEWYQVAANEGHADAQGAVDRLKTQVAKANEEKADDESNLTVADLVEPAAGEEGEGDASPPGDGRPAADTGRAVNDDGRAVAPQFRSDLVAKVQDALMKRGLLPKGTPSGVIDQPTEDAIRAWQEKSGLAVDGEPSKELLDKLSPAQN